MIPKNPKKSHFQYENFEKFQKLTEKSRENFAIGTVFGIKVGVERVLDVKSFK